MIHSASSIGVIWRPGIGIWPTCLVSTTPESMGVADEKVSGETDCSTIENGARVKAHHDTAPLEQSSYQVTPSLPGPESGRAGTQLDVNSKELRASRMMQGWLPQTRFAGPDRVVISVVSTSHAQYG